ncbi:MAG TPA: LysM peptidoglycan-binding domain-containing protein [Rectinema sp.]|jgi:murein DD-endopeptidase MepM/ murein hydrolase activator NlpD|nr:LysM peptidoglycan-binding domain-containing protein [Spirochaetia bacterium]MDI9427286.1 LysM peptidoglycan-binding domain-containing protein [Spirochaetota bacterium]NLH89411.1 LysM peptidoglycan-binding domain-containing protein [Treponema sp.]OQC74404.1 MAG: Murein hydrolase activator EnvC precursor [Spirochaetes bacterium ADurb.Bin001]HNP92749.1 LysM peptidoglycan-binding domain-containing protein [Rectinema sp.]
MVRRILKASIFFLLFGLLLTISGAEQEYHVIQAGETLYSIAKSYSVPYETLASINSITDPSKIRPGVVLLIPRVHIVAKGETYYGLSKQYGISIQELKSANNLSDIYVLKVGDVLIIPEKGVISVQTVQDSPPLDSVVDSVAMSQPVASASTQQNSSSPANTAIVPSNSVSTTSSTSQAVLPPNSPTTSSSAASQSTNPPAQTSAPTKADSPKTSVSGKRIPDAIVNWPVDGKAQYMSGKLEGVMFQTARGASVKAVASGTVVSAGPSRGYGEVVFVQSKAGFVYVYAGNESILVKTGEIIEPGKAIAKVGVDANDGNPIAYFFVFRNGQPVDPSLAPRD